MATRDHHPVDALILSHTPLVGYAVTAVAPRLPDPGDLDGLVAAGVDGLRLAAEFYVASGRDSSGFATFVKPRIAAALADAIAGGPAAAAPASPPPVVADLLLHMESVPRDSDLLAAAHPAAFAASPTPPRRQAGHYAAVAAASDFRSHLDSQPAQAPNAAQLRGFGS